MTEIEPIVRRLAAELVEDGRIEAGLITLHEPNEQEPSENVNIEEAAAILRIPVATLRFWRHKGEGPAGFKLGRRVMFKREDVLAFIEREQRKR